MVAQFNLLASAKKEKERLQSISIVASNFVGARAVCRRVSSVSASVQVLSTSLLAI